MRRLPLPLLALTLLLSLGGAARADEVDSTHSRTKLADIVGNVQGATRYGYDRKDSNGHVLDTVKILQTGSSAYVGVYHSNVGGRFDVKVATSSDLMTWKHRADLDQHGNHPTVAALSDGGYLVVYEKRADDGTNHLRFRYYRSLRSLLGGGYHRQFTAPLTLSPWSEGTPHVYDATLRSGIGDSTINVGFHYHADLTGDGVPDEDRQARGTLTNFSEWRSEKATALDELFKTVWHAGFTQESHPQGADGHIGDRDHVVIDGHSLNLHEAQYTLDDWSTWRVFQFDHLAGSLHPIEVSTHGASTSFGNPTATVLTSPAGNPAVAVSLFLFSEGAAPGEAGSLVFYRETGTGSGGGGDDGDSTPGNGNRPR